MTQPTIQAGSIVTYSGYLASTSPFGKVLNVTVGAGSNRTLFLALTCNSSSGTGPPASLTVTFGGTSGVGGTALSLYGTYDDVGANNASFLYKLDDPSVGTAELFVGVSSWYGQEVGLSAFVVHGLKTGDRYSPISSYRDTAATTPRSVSISATPDDITLYLVSCLKSDIAIDAGQTAFAASPAPVYVSTNFRHSYKLGASSSVGSSWASGGTTQLTDLAVVLKGALSVAGDINVTTDPAVFSGSAGPGNSSQAAVAITTDAALFAGSAGTVAATLTTAPFKNNTGTVLAGLTGLTVAAIRMTDFALAGVFTGQTTNGSGVMTINSTSITAGVEYAVVTRNAAGVLGVEKYTATA